MGTLPALYGEMLVAVAMGAGSFDGAEASYTRARENYETMNTLYAKMGTLMMAMGGDPDESNNASDGTADDQADPNDVQTGITGGKPGCTDDCPWPPPKK